MADEMADRVGLAGGTRIQTLFRLVAVFLARHRLGGGGSAFRCHVVAPGPARRLSEAKAHPMILSCHDSVSFAAGEARMRPVTVNYA